MQSRYKILYSLSTLIILYFSILIMYTKLNKLEKYILLIGIGCIFIFIVSLMYKQRDLVFIGHFIFASYLLWATYFSKNIHIKYFAFIITFIMIILWKIYGTCILNSLENNIFERTILYKNELISQLINIGPYVNILYLLYYFYIT